MSNLPIYYDFQNAIQSRTNPIPVYKVNNATTWYFARYILQKIISAFKFTNIPDTWAKNYLEYVLFCNGVVAVVDTIDYGVIPQACGLTGYNVFWCPRSALVQNPLLPELSGKPLIIGKDCELIKINGDYGGLLDLVLKYATEYALATQAFDVTLINSKLAYAFSAGGKATAESLKKMFDDITQGNPAVFIDTELLNDNKPSWTAVFNDGRGSSILNELLNALEKLDARLNTDIGIPNVNISKASGVTDAEVNANNIDTQSKVSLWLENIKDSLEKVNNMFFLNIGCELRFKQEEPERGSADYADDGEINGMGTV